MASSPGRAFSKENLYEAVCKEPYYGNENVLNTHMNRLRAKLKDPKKPGQEYIRMGNRLSCGSACRRF